jgi:cytochrome c oxidase assembly protein subunit 15
VSGAAKKGQVMAGKRSIFEEVGAGQAAVKPPVGGGIDARPKGARRGIRLWLVALFLLVATMIAVGGLTRLTDSGLSITEWRPVTGALPPMNAEAWDEEFQKYRAIPEYQLQNKGMSLEEFKVIYWWEWGHRQLGRVIGLVWAVGFIGFAVARQIPPGWTGRLLLLGALGGLQGAIGWWMVSSGLGGQRLDVASYRLATHLGLAFVILGFLAWYVLLLGRSEAELMTARRGREAKLLGLSTGLMHFAFLQILLGALVAGIDAGRAFPTWPLMNGSFFPADAFYVPDGAGGSLPVWHAFFENPGLVQFMHRMAGYGLLAFGVVVWLRGRKSAYQATRRAFHAVMLMLLAQMVLGIVTVLTVAHMHVAITHQIGAVILWVLILRARHLSNYPVAGSIREGTA